MRDQTIAAWLGELASSAPAPGGGAAAALELAIACALVEMVCNLTIGKPAFAEHEQAMTAARERAGVLREEALELAAEDAAAFEAVIAAYRLPRESEAEATVRHERVQEALAAAAAVPRRTAEHAAGLVALTEPLVAYANPNVVSDLAAAAAAARAALATALVNVEINRASITDPELAGELDAAAAEIEGWQVMADDVVAAVRRRLAA